MSAVLLDTNVLSELMRRRPSARVMERLRRLPGDDLATSAVCVMELRFGAARLPHGARLWKQIEDDVLTRVTVLPITGREAVRAGEILADLEARGVPVGVEDVLIGATALTHRLALVSRNVRHFARIEGLVVENWWE